MRRRVQRVSDRTVDVLLIGGGIAAASCAHELRERGFQGSITLVTREQDPPYHRPPITKGYLRGDEDRDSTLIHPVAWYAEHDVELLTRTPVMSLDPAAREAKVGREVIGFDQALLATGAMVRRLRTDGATRGNIHYLRALGNADTLREAVEDAERVVVVGGSYIATEVAASLTALGKTLHARHAGGAAAGARLRADRRALRARPADLARHRDRRRGRRRRVRRRGRRRGPVRRRRLRRRPPHRGRPRRRRLGRAARRHARAQGRPRHRRQRRRLLRQAPADLRAERLRRRRHVRVRQRPARPPAAHRARGGRGRPGPPRRRAR